MADDRTTVVETKSSGAGWAIAAILVVALVAGIFFFSQMSGSEVAKNNAVTNAANSVGSAAKDVGSAAKDATGK